MRLAPVSLLEKVCHPLLACSREGAKESVPAREESGWLCYEDSQESSDFETRPFIGRS